MLKTRDNRKAMPEAERGLAHADNRMHLLWATSSGVAHTARQDRGPSLSRQRSERSIGDFYETQKPWETGFKVMVSS